MRSRWCALLLVFLQIVWVFGWTAKAQASGKINWSAPETASYSGLQDTILAYKMELYAGGYSLSLKKTTTDPAEADFVMNTYGDMGAGGIIELTEGLEEDTDSLRIKNFGTSVRMKQNQVYLIVLHDGTYAKLRIDRVTPVKVTFTYVLEEPAAEPQPVTPPATDPKPAPPVDNSTVKVLEEGAVTLKWEAGKNEAAWDIYRSDNGQNFVRLNDFRLTEAIFTDGYAVSGHTYLYKYVAFNKEGVKVFESPVYTLKVVPAGTLTPSAPPEQPQTKIVLQLDNTKASVNGKPYTLEVAPTLLYSTTMVPVRFVAEALGAKVAWNGENRTITITLNGDRILLAIDSVRAEVNGSETFMTVPATIVDGTTLVPVRFVSENLKLKVDYIDSTREIVITSQEGTPAAPVDDVDPDTDDPQPAARDFSFYFHLWQLAVPGTVYENSQGNTVTTVGALSGGLLINEDGTYLWNSTWDDRLIEGVWEEHNDSAYPIILRDAQEGKDWLVGRTNDGDGIYVWSGDYMHYIGVVVD